MIPDVLGAVLAGGESRRFGAPKALAPFRGEAMGLRAIRTLRAVCPRVVLVTSVPQVAAALQDEDTSLKVVPDRIPGAGPLAGLQAALHEADEGGATGVLLLACDMPLVTPALMARVAREGRRSGRPAAVATSGTGRAQPLCGWYDVGILAVVEKRLIGDDRSMDGLLLELDAHRIPSDRSPEGPGGGEELRSANTPDELARLEALAARG